MAASRVASVGLAVALVVLVLAVYAPVRSHDFVNYDDPIYVVDNQNLRDGPTPAAVWRAFREPYETNWIPLTWISLQIDHALHGTQAPGYLLANVAMHALSTLLLFAAFARATRAPFASAFVAAVFAVHPLHVESVAWVSERKDALSGVFFTAALWLHVRYAEAPGALRYLAVLAAGALGLLAKPMLVILPFVLLLLDFWPLRRLGNPVSPRALGRAALEKLPLLAMAAAVAVVTFAVQRDAGAMHHADMLPFGVRVQNALISWVWYLEKAFWPTGLAVFYPHPARGVPTGAAVLAALLLAAITAAAVRSARTRPYFAMGWLWYLGSLVPVIGLVQVGMQARADRYSYLPLIGISLAVAFGARDLLAARRRTAAVLGGAAVAALAAVAHAQVDTWRDGLSLFERAAAVTRDNFFAHHGLGAEYLERGRLALARAHYAEAARIQPGWGAAHVGLADVLAEEGRLEEAILRYRRGLALAPDDARGHANLGWALVEAGRTGPGLAHYRRALELSPPGRHARIHARMGNAFLERNEPRRAVRHFRSALASDPGFDTARGGLGVALLRIGRLDEARPEIEAALRADPQNPDLHVAAAQLAAQRGDAAAVARHYRAALDARPGWVLAANNLAWLLATHPDPALRDPRAAVRIAEAIAAAQPDAQVLDTLAAAYAAAGRYPEAVAAVKRALAGDPAPGPDVAADLRARLALYRGGRPYLEAVTPP